MVTFVRGRQRRGPTSRQTYSAWHRDATEWSACPAARAVYVIATGAADAVRNRHSTADGAGDHAITVWTVVNSADSPRQSTSTSTATIEHWHRAGGRRAHPP